MTSDQKCNCGARDGGWHDPGCPAGNAPFTSKTINDLVADLHRTAAGQQALTVLSQDKAKWLLEQMRPVETTKRQPARKEVERRALELRKTGVKLLRADESAAHYSAPPGCKCADCSLDGEACPECYEAWWRVLHPNVIRHAEEPSEHQHEIAATGERIRPQNPHNPDGGTPSSRERQERSAGQPTTRNLGPEAPGGVGVTDLAARSYNPFHAMEEHLEAAVRPKPCEKCSSSGRLIIYDTPTYIGQLCGPIGDEPCPECQPEKASEMTKRHDKLMVDIGYSPEKVPEAKASAESLRRLHTGHPANCPCWDCTRAQLKF